MTARRRQDDRQPPRFQRKVVLAAVDAGWLAKPIRPVPVCRITCTVRGFIAVEPIWKGAAEAFF